MKYNIGDVIKFKTYIAGDINIHYTSIGIITAIPTTRYPLYYEVIIAGIEGIKHYVYEDTIDDKL